MMAMVPFPLRLYIPMLRSPFRHVPLFTLGLAGLLTAVSLPAATPPAPPATPTTLRAAATAKGLHFGTAVKASSLANDATYREVLLREFSMVTPENELKWSATQPAEGRYNFTQADQIVAFATQHGLAIRGHTLCWDADRYLPKWMLARTFTRDEAATLLRDHIFTVMRRYQGRIKYWDVVNEAVANDNRPGAPALFHEFWSRHLGEDYIALAFRYAHEADPQAVLFYNDYDHGDAMGLKSNRIYELLKRLLAAGVPVHGVGLQSHCNLAKPPTYADLRANYERLGKLGLRVHVTELDVYPVGVPGTLEERLQKQAAVYRDVVAAAIDSRACDAIVTWGFTDKFNQVGINRRKKLPDNTPTLLWLFDENYRPKPSYHGVLEALRRP
jgi:endo-1,4-beta-xylanase